MGLFGRIQVNGALQRLGKRIAANPYLWQIAADGRPHFDHWVEEHASDGDLIRAAADLTSFHLEIPPRYMTREWGQQLSDIVRGSAECVKREIHRRGLAESGDVIDEADSASPVDTSSTQQGESMNSEAPNSSEARQPILDLYRDALKDRQKQFAGQIHSEADERSVRLTALIDVSIKLYKSHLPGMDIALEDQTNRGNMAQNLSAEYLVFLMLDPDELPRVFAEYILWKFGTDEAVEKIVDVEYLKEAIKRGISLLPKETREATIAIKENHNWGRLI